MPPTIHPTAIISVTAELGPDVEIGPFVVIDGPVVLGPGCKVGPHVHLIGPLTVGPKTVFHAGCVIGDAPQHLGYDGTPTNTVIGEANTFREQCTVHRGMPISHKPGTGITTIGNHNFFMANAHVAHDCRIGNHCVITNGALLGGHAEVGDRAVISGNTAVHQFCRIGRMAMLGGTCAVTQDMPPFWIVQNGLNRARGVNVVGMRRGGIPASEINAVRHAFRLIVKSNLTIGEAVTQIETEYGTLPAVRELIEFIRTTKRGICTGRTQSDDD